MSNFIQNITSIAIVVIAIALLDGFLLCPFRELSGFLCPFCQTSSSLKLLSDGELLKAVQLNGLVYFLVVVFALGSVDKKWSFSEIVSWPIPLRGYLLLIITVVFWIWRNL